MLGLKEYIKEIFSKELTYLDRLKIARERVRKGIVQAAEARDIATCKKDKQDITETITWMKKEKKVLDKLIKKEEKKNGRL